MISPEKIAEMLAAAEKATAGAWKAEGYVVFGDWQASGAIAVIKTAEKAFADTKYIAFCDPETITAVLSELLTLRAEKDEARGHAATLLRTAQEDLVLMQETAATVTSLRERAEAVEAQLARQGEALKRIQTLALSEDGDDGEILEIVSSTLSPEDSQP